MIKCSYCNQSAELVKGDVIYPHRQDLHKHNFYRCKECNAFVGCHYGTKLPLGTLANLELRELRKSCHKLIDKLWTNSEERKIMYSNLAKFMRVDEIHIAECGIDECKTIIELLEE